MFAHSHSIKDHPRQVAGVAGLGAVLGAATAVLFTPRRGSEVRHGIKERSKAMKDKAVHINMKDGAKDSGGSATERTKSLAQSTAERAKGTVRKIKDDTKDTAKEAKDTAKGIRQDGKDFTDEIRRRGEP